MTGMYGKAKGPKPHQNEIKIHAKNIGVIGDNSTVVMTVSRNNAIPSIGLLEDNGNVDTINVGGGRKVEVIMRKREREEEFVDGPTPDQLLHDKIQANEVDGKTCVVCLENEPCCIATPCMHLIYCVKCARNLCFGPDGDNLKKVGEVKCAECRGEVKTIQRVFQ